MLKKILLVIAIIIAGIIIVSRFQPDSYTVERSAIIDAPPEVVFAHMNDFREWQQFNAWGDADPNAVYTYSDVSSGVGAKLHWKGNSEMGEGRMTILESRPNEYVKVDLEFIEPFAGKAITEYVMASEGAGTKLTQSMHSDHNFFSKIMCLFMDMDKMIGEKYEEGFRRMNKVLPVLKPAPEPEAIVPADSTVAQ
ncbi:MAG: SRPBCC family protein [Flavobacteriales bacterium]|nr:SRPBCC family protein [Flavobacteriales bacterium]